MQPYRGLEATLGLTVGVGLLALLALSGAATAAADSSDGTTAAPSGTPAERTAPASGEKQASDPASDTPGEMFPGVKGISGKELEQRIEEYRRRKAEEARRQSQPRPSPESPAPAGTPAPAAPSSPAPATQPEQPQPSAAPQPASAPATPAPQPAPAPAPPAPATQPPSSPASPATPAGPAAGTPAETAGFLKFLENRAARCEDLLKKADDVRSGSIGDAARVGDERHIQDLLQFTRQRTDETQAYQRILAFPILVYQYVYEQTDEAARSARYNRPPKLSEAEVRRLEEVAGRLKASRRASLLAVAELDTRVRDLKVAEKIYIYLVLNWPGDEEIRKSSEAFLKINNARRPDLEPSTQQDNQSQRKGPNGGRRRGR